MKKEVPLELEKGEMPLNTFSNKAPFVAKIKSVERCVGPNATGETCHIVIETDGKIPFWEGQSYGVIPPVRRLAGAGARGQGRGAGGTCTQTRHARPPATRHPSVAAWLLLPFAALAHCTAMHAHCATSRASR